METSAISHAALPGKPPELVTSYRPISLLPSLSQLFKKYFLSD